MLAVRPSVRSSGRRGFARRGWSGGAATDFSAGWSEVRDGGGQIITALREMAEKLGVSAQTYESRDWTNASALNTSGDCCTIG
ncbi:WXG100 family type VII secretion target [Nocardia sp. NBC_00508]|nr:WXG100 family type VII secretion target [Nocardia sp. NBC_00508]